MKHKAEIDKTHLRDLITDAERCKALTVEYNGVYCDYARQRVTPETMKKLYKLADAADLKGKINAMFSGEHINSTEDRAVLHVGDARAEGQGDQRGRQERRAGCARSPGQDQGLHREGAQRRVGGATGKPLTSVVAVGTADRFWARSSCTRRCARARRLRRARAGASCGSSRTSTPWTWRAR